MKYAEANALVEETAQGGPRIDNEDIIAMRWIMMLTPTDTEAYLTHPLCNRTLTKWICDNKTRINSYHLSLRLRLDTIEKFYRDSPV